MPERLRRTGHTHDVVGILSCIVVLQEIDAYAGSQAGENAQTKYTDD